jgi:hypothetical protein
MKMKVTALAGAGLLCAGLAFATPTAKASVTPLNAPVAVCNTAGNCMDRYQLGTGLGTKLIDYKNDNDNGEYVVPTEIDRCSGGFEVMSTCPFQVGSGLNTANEGDRIVQEEFLAQGGGSSYGCLGTTGSTSSDGPGTLVKCNAIATGTGGGTGTVIIVCGTGDGNSGGCGAGELVDLWGTGTQSGYNGDPYGDIGPDSPSGAQLDVNTQCMYDCPDWNP